MENRLVDLLEALAKRLNNDDEKSPEIGDCVEMIERKKLMIGQLLENYKDTKSKYLIMLRAAYVMENNIYSYLVCFLDGEKDKEKLFKKIVESNAKILKTLHEFLQELEKKDECSEDE